MLFITKPIFKRDPRASLADTSELRKITLLLILLTICTAAAIVGYSFLLHHLVGTPPSSSLTFSPNKEYSIITNELLTIAGRSSASQHVTSTRPIEKPKIGNNGDRPGDNDGSNDAVASIYNNPAKIVPEKYNEFRSRSIREKMQQMSANAGERKPNERAQPPKETRLNFTVKNIHIFYSAPVNWYRPINSTYTRFGVDNGDAAPYEQQSDSLNIVFQPMLGIYSITAKVLAKHFANICGMGIGVVIVTWRPEPQPTEMLKQILNFVKQYHLGKLSIAIEIDGYAGRTASSVRGNIELLHREFVWSHPALYRVFVMAKGEYLPMIYVRNVGEVPFLEWAKVLSGRGGDTVRRTIYDGVFIGHIR